MVVVLERVLSTQEVAQFRDHLSRAQWQDGRQTAGSLAQHVKQNSQLPEDSEPAISLGQHILKRLGQHAGFVSAALPDSIYPPKFNCYRESQTYGAHIDGALMQVPGTRSMMRTDLSATLFLSNPQDYDGGELSIETQYGQQSFKCDAGDLVLYPATSLHQVTPVKRGERLAAFFWIQSMVRDVQQRELLYQLDQSIQALTRELSATHPEVTHLSGVYHNLIRQWSNPTF